MTPMIVLGKNRVFRVVALEHSRCMRHANVEHAVRRMLARGFDHRCARLLLEDIPDHLDRADILFALAQLDCFVKPADRRAKRCAPHANFSFALQIAKRLPDLGITHVLHLDVVELKHVDVVGLESLEALVDGESHVIASRSRCGSSLCPRRAFAAFSS